MTTDKGIKKALGQQPAFRLPSNFGYRTMLRIEEEVSRREKRQERRLYTVMIVLCTVSAAGILALAGWMYGEKLMQAWQETLHMLPSTDTLLFGLPMLSALPLLYLLNLWMRKVSRKYLGLQD